MAWARLDDRWHDHPKVIAVGLEGAGLFVMCLTWAHQARRTSHHPGVVPTGVVERFAGGAKGKRLAAVLVRERLFDAPTDAGWPIHDFDDYLPKYDPQQAREAGARGGRKRATNRQQLASEPLSEPLAGSVADGQRTSSTRASVRRNPVPVPNPEPNGSGSAEPTAQTLLAEWIDHCTDAPPSRVKGHVAKELGVMLTEGIPAGDVRAGLAAWHQRRLNPAALASVVHELRQGPGTRGRPTPMDRATATMAIAEQMQAEHDRAQIGAS